MRKIIAATLMVLASAASATMQEPVESGCERQGEIAKQYALLRDASVSLEALQGLIDSDASIPARDRPSRKLLAKAVYERPDDTPDVARKVFIRSCVGGTKAQLDKAH
jgi:hypothetical protein